MGFLLVQALIYPRYSTVFTPPHRHVFVYSLLYAQLQMVTVIWDCFGGNE